MKRVLALALPVMLAMILSLFLSSCSDSTDTSKVAAAPPVAASDDPDSSALRTTAFLWPRVLWWLRTRWM